MDMLMVAVIKVVTDLLSDASMVMNWWEKVQPYVTRVQLLGYREYQDAGVSFVGFGCFNLVFISISPF